MTTCTPFADTHISHAQYASAVVPSCCLLAFALLGPNNKSLSDATTL